MLFPRFARRWVFKLSVKNKQVNCHQQQNGRECWLLVTFRFVYFFTVPIAIGINTNDGNYRIIQFLYIYNT